MNTQNTDLEGFKGRLRVVSFLQPGELEARAKLTRVAPGRYISQTRLAALDALHKALTASLASYELNRDALLDDIRRNLPIEPGTLTATIVKNQNGGADFVQVKGAVPVEISGWRL
jgi:hypothetical protein